VIASNTIQFYSKSVISSLSGDKRLTGVGLCTNALTSPFFAPPAASMRWDNSGYTLDQSQEFGVGLWFKNGLYGSLFHESC
jgi:hypothetical protein